MSDLLFIRHAETDMAGTFCGHLDPELNARGLLQLEELTSPDSHGKHRSGVYQRSASGLRDSKNNHRSLSGRMLRVFRAA